MIINRENESDIYSYKKTYRKYYIDESFFERVDTPEKAYILGLMYADAGVSFSEKPLKYRITLTLQEKDRYLLERLSTEFFKTNKPLYSGGGGKYYKLDISSKKMASDIVKLGCVPCKSLILKFPTSDQVPQHLLKYFILGDFDGDGCICHRKGAMCYDLRFFGSVDMMANIREYLTKNAGISNGWLRDFNNPSIKELIFSGAEDARKLHKFLYDGIDLFLIRKKKRFEENDKLRDVMDVKHNPFKEIDGVTNRICTKCKIYKPLDCFNSLYTPKAKHNKHYICKECKKAYGNYKRKKCGI